MSPAGQAERQLDFPLRVIPGAREANTTPRTTSEALGGVGFGERLVGTATDPTLDDATREDRRREGGGGAAS